MPDPRLVRDAAGEACVVVTVFLQVLLLLFDAVVVCVRVTVHLGDYCGGLGTPSGALSRVLKNVWGLHTTLLLALSFISDWGKCLPAR